MRTLANKLFTNYVRGMALIYTWVKLLQPDYAKILFRPINKIETIEDEQVFIDARELGYDALKYTNDLGVFKFYEGVLHVVPCMTKYQLYTNMWIDKKHILSNKLVEYDMNNYNQCINFHNVVQRFSLLYANPYANKNIGFDHCNDCAIEGHIWKLYKTKFDKNINVHNEILYLSKLYNGGLLDTIHEYLFPKATDVDIKLHIKQVLKDLIPAKYFNKMTNFTSARLPKLVIDMNYDKKIDYFKIEDSHYNNFINIPARKYILSHLNHLVRSGMTGTYTSRFFVILYYGCVDDPTIWLLTKFFPEIRIICFEPQLMNIYVEQYGNTHWKTYDDVKNNISYLSINTSNTTEDDLDIRPIIYFDDKEIAVLDKNSDQYDLRKSITEIADYDLFAKYIFFSEKRIFICEENLTAECTILMNKLYQTTDTNSHPNYVLWVNNKPASEVMSILSVLEAKVVKYIVDQNTKFDLNEFYVCDAFLLPWSNRQYPEIALHVDLENNNVKKKIDINEILNRVFYYNLIDRVCLHSNSGQERISGFDCCGDCALENRIISNLRDEYNLSSVKWGTNNIVDNLSLSRDISIITGLKTFIVNGHGTLYTL